MSDTEIVETMAWVPGWLRRNWVRLHGGALVTAWGVFEWLAPRAADKVHHIVLYVFWHGVMHSIFQAVKGL